LTQNNPGTGKISRIISLMMLMVFLGLGYFFLGTNMMIREFPRPNRTYIGLLLVGWAIFRGFMVWQRYKRTKQDDDGQ
jgi:hypothetical protein